jgi:hypothetical protein
MQETIFVELTIRRLALDSTNNDNSDDHLITGRQTGAHLHQL